jgi:hypothetical protein
VAICLLALALAAVTPSSAAAAGESVFNEYQVKAAFIKNFVKFGGRSLTYRRIGKLQDADGCQILFVTRKEAQALPEILAALAGRDVLTIGDSETLAKEGLMIGFLLEEQKVRFEANLEPVRRAGLSISSRLLGLAKTVYNPR